jgi:hypothetical protein
MIWVRETTTNGCFQEVHLLGVDGDKIGTLDISPRFSGKLLPLTIPQRLSCVSGNVQVRKMLGMIPRSVATPLRRIARTQRVLLAQSSILPVRLFLLRLSSLFPDRLSFILRLVFQLHISRHPMHLSAFPIALKSLKTFMKSLCKLSRTAFLHVLKL